MAPTTGAWTSEDPVWSEPRYGYAHARPSAIRDPSGRAGVYGLLSCMGAGSAMIGAGAAAIAIAPVGGAGVFFLALSEGADPAVAIAAGAATTTFISSQGGAFIAAGLALRKMCGPNPVVP